MSRRLVCLVAVALFVTACGGSDSASADTYTSDSFGFSIDIPDNFSVIDDTEDDLQGLLAETELSENAQLVIAGTLSSPLSGFVLWGFDFAAGNADFIPHINIVRQPRAPGEDAAFFRGSIAADYLTGSGAEVLSIEDIEVETGASLLVEALFPISGQGRSHAFQLITFTDTYSYTITYNYIEPGEAERDLAVRSFRTFTADE